MKASRFYESDFLNAESIGLHPRELQISAVSEATVKNNDGTESTKLVVHFSNSAKPLLVNRTNAKKIIESLGDETDDWIGATLVLVTGKQTFNGRTFACIQIAGCRVSPAKTKK